MHTLIKPDARNNRPVQQFLRTKALLRQRTQLAKTQTTHKVGKRTPRNQQLLQPLALCDVVNLRVKLLAGTHQQAKPRIP
ncbi:hypothetical protein D3C72_2414920 [compost metagenome]